jgi:predicted TIM-barrel fold metal-dependent hydrolase
MAGISGFGPRDIPVRADWLAQRKEPVRDATCPIVDPHHHLWQRGAWRYLFDDVLVDLNCGHNIRATVYVQGHAMHRAAGPRELRPVGETEFANGVAAMSASGGYGETRVCAGIVGQADLRRGAAVRPVLEAHLRAGGDRFRGIRHIVAHNADPWMVETGNPAQPGLMADAGFRAGFAELAPLGLTFEAWLYHTQLRELAALARAFPQTGIVVNHAGGPLGVGAYAGQRTEVLRDWASGILELAQCPNVYVKLGGLGMRVGGFDFDARPIPPSSDDLAAAWRPYVETCVAAFGPRRCMFESNFPQDKGSYSYGVFWNACKALVADASAVERADLFHDTAARFYRLDIPLSADLGPTGSAVFP